MDGELWNVVLPAALLLGQAVVVVAVDGLTPCDLSRGETGETGDLLIRVEVYSKRECCLCEAAKAALLEVRREIPFDLREIDIESAPELYAAYKERVPLILINGRLAFKFRVDGTALRRRLTREISC